MRIGISVAQCGRLARPPAVAAAVRAAEQLGYSTVWVCDAVLDPAGVLSAVAAVTGEVGLGAAIVVGPEHDPAVLARSLATVAVRSEGRLSVALGLAPGCPEERMDDVVDALEAGWTEGRRPLTVLDGTSPAALDRVARRGDGWSPPGLAADVLAHGWATVRHVAAAQGRDAERMQLVVRAGIVLSPAPVAGPRAPFQGDADQVADDVDATRRIGADEVVLCLAGDLSLDEALDGYARIAEATEARSARRT